MVARKDDNEWSRGTKKYMLIEQRKHLWEQDTLTAIATWAGIEPGMTVVDVGCGLGFLGRTYWPLFGEDGLYVGIDVSSRLLHEAAGAAGKWAEGGRAEFAVGSAYELPLQDGFADLIMCQTLLLHLEHPRRALSEMMRVIKPGGVILCHEPDNLSASLMKNYYSDFDLTIEEDLLMRKCVMIRNQGRIKLGRGDWNIPPKIPRMLHELGLVEIGARIKDQVSLIHPPYDDPVAQQRLKVLKKLVLHAKDTDEETIRAQEEFLAAAGDPNDFERLKEIIRCCKDRARQQLEKGEFFRCGAYPFYIIKARKPKQTSE